ncbi:hydroxyacid dehydrogenase [Paenibacillus rigui]|uniref:Hydroxyacid dehydrogenase n=1 Tax=Paenibacillus rigui TaxID=554312 RepID=A0A229ULX1_9BACL|nr:hydroxyacid dehydrogenase [Paenibacillus rigui]OXM84373.1 hydroxyacid dehydrogenase [Paenibacillus rigui]
MAKPKILQILSMYHEAGEHILQQGAELMVTHNDDEEHLCELVRDVEGIVLRAPARITPRIIDAAPRLKVISGAGVGLDNIDVHYASIKRIPVLHAPAVNSVSTAEHTVMLLLALSKSLLPFHAEMSRGNYHSRMIYSSMEVQGKRVGLVGFGRIAKEVAKRLRFGFDMKVTAWVRSDDPLKHRQAAEELEVELTTDLDQLFAQSDFVSVHIPLNSFTRGSINRHHFSRMKKGAFLINTARGGVIDQEALLEALQTGLIAGAGLDVFESEPPPSDLKLLQLPNVIVTPHVGGTTRESNYRMATTVAEQVLAVLAGSKPLYIGNPEVLEP